MDGGSRPGRRRLLCFLDKNFPPEHSFVTGMLADAFPKYSGTKVVLVTGEDSDARGVIRRFHRAIAYAGLPRIPAKGVARTTLVVKCLLLGRRLILRSHARGEDVTLFVRNDPVMLLVCTLLQWRYGVRLIFQNSFALEDTHSRRMMRRLHRTLYRIGCRRVDGLLAVSPLGLKRVRSYAPDGVPGESIPLLADSVVDESFAQEWQPRVGKAMSFVYAGTHHPRRRIEVVLRSIVGALQQGVDARFVFIGLDEAASDRYRRIEGVKSLVERGDIVFRERMPRPKVLDFLSRCDVGLSLVPDCPMNREMSPTKLAEYMGAGLAVLGSQGVELQERFIEQSQAGLIVSFNQDAILRGIIDLAADPEKVEEYRRKAYVFARENLRYSVYVPTLERLLR